MAGIRVNTGAKRIEVNDNGDYIVLNFGDHDFPNRFFALLDTVQEIAEKAAEKEKELKEKYEGGSLEQQRVSFAFDCELHKEIAAEVDNVFGPDTCKKVFGDIVPGVELYDDFFHQLMPYFEQFGKERAQRMSKYSAARSGNV